MLESPKTSILRRVFDAKELNNAKLSSNEKMSNKCLISIPKIRTPIDLTGKAMFINPMFIKVFISHYIIKKPDVNYWQSESLFEVCICTLNIV